MDMESISFTSLGLKHQFPEGLAMVHSAEREAGWGCSSQMYTFLDQVGQNSSKESKGVEFQKSIVNI